MLQEMRDDSNISKLIEIKGYRARKSPIGDRKSTRLNSSHGYISYAVFCLKKKKNPVIRDCMRSSSTFDASTSPSRFSAGTMCSHRAFCPQMPLTRSVVLHGSYLHTRAVTS